MIYELIIGYTCNWNCDYCAVDTHNKIISEKEVFLKIDDILENSIVILSGGELGTMNKNYILNVINKLKDKSCELHLNTNGLFIKKYSDLLHHFTKINYHCSENLNLEDKLIYGNFNYLLIVTDKNVGNLQSFLEKHKEINFNIIPATTPSTGIKNAPILTKENRMMILKKFGTKLNKQSKINLLNGVDYSKIIYI